MELEVTKEDVEKLIEVEKADTFFTHLKCFLSNNTIPMGEIEHRKIKVWNPNKWNWFFYPIFEFEFNSQNHLIKISDKVNPVSKTLIFVVPIMVVLTLLYSIIPNFHFPSSIYFILVILCILLFFIYKFYRQYIFEKENQLEQIFEMLDIETEKKEPKNEWSLRNIITRVVLYPISIGMLFLSIFYFLPNGNYYLAIGSFIFFGYYLYIDLMIIFTKKNN